MNDKKKHRGVVFKISHPDVDDKCYIGQTLQSLSARWSTLKTNAKKWKGKPEESFKLSRLYKAIMDHGPDKMEIVELEGHENSSKDELVKILKEREAHFINVNNFNAEANLPKKITSFSVIDKQMQPSFLEAVG